MRSAVAGTSERLKRRVFEVSGLSEVFNDLNVHLLVKSSPEKTVAGLSPIAEKAGRVVKLNDSGTWRRRFGLLVPHTFLYYYVSGPNDRGSAAELRPHGVIDLELYTDIQVLDGNVVRLAPEDDMLPIRTFYFQLPNKAEAEEWASAIRDTRYSVVKQERDALRGSKAALTEQVDILSRDLRLCRADVEALQKREAAALSELARYDAINARRVEQVQALLAAAGADPTRSGIHGNGRAMGTGGGTGGVRRAVPPRGGGASGAFSELAALEEAIADRDREIAELKAENEAIRREMAAAAQLRERDAADTLNLLNQEQKRADDEAAACRAAEDDLALLRRELEEARARAEEARGNLGVVAAACREAEAKNRELQEHRRVLAREVKASRAEKRRLSAALACATTAAAAAAATVEVSRSASDSLGDGGPNAAAVGSGENALLPSEELARGVACDGGDCGGGNGGDVGTSGDSGIAAEGDRMVGGRVRSESTDDVKVSGAKYTWKEGGGDDGGMERCRASPAGAGEAGDACELQVPIQQDEPVESCQGSQYSGDSHEHGQECGEGSSSVRGCASNVECASLNERNASPPRRPSILCLDRNSSDTVTSRTDPDEETPRADTGLISPEASPSVHNSGASGGGGCGGNNRPILFPVETRGSAAAEVMEPCENSTATASIISGGDDGSGRDDASISSCRRTCGSVIKDAQNDVPAGGGGDSGDAKCEDRGSFVGSPLSSPLVAAAAGSPGTESRFDAIVQSFSVGLRESRRARRRPLLGSLDDACDHDDGKHDDGPTTGGGDSRHDLGEGAEGGEKGGAGGEAGGGAGSLRRSSSATAPGASMTSLAGFFSGSFGGEGGADKDAGQRQVDPGPVGETEDKPGVNAQVDNTTENSRNVTPAYLKEARDLPFVISAFPGAVPPPPPAAAPADPSEVITGGANMVGSMLNRVVAKVRHQTAVSTVDPVVSEDGARSVPSISPDRPRSSTIPADGTVPSSVSTLTAAEGAAAAATARTGARSSGAWKVVSVTPVSSAAADVADPSPTKPQLAQRCEGDGGQPSCSTDTNDQSKVVESPSLPASSTPPASLSSPRPGKASDETLETLSDGGSGGGRRGDSPVPTSVATTEEALDGGAAAVMAAAAAAAAERGSRASLEAAAAARRWEAKLKGSFVSIAGGVRWGMTTPRVNGPGPSFGSRNDADK